MLCALHYVLQRNLLTFNCMTVVTRTGKVVSTDLQSITSYAHSGKMTDLSVSDTSGGNVLVLFGTAEGTLFLVRLVAPFTPGAGPEDLQASNTGVACHIIQNIHVLVHYLIALHSNFMAAWAHCFLPAARGRPRRQFFKSVAAAFTPVLAACFLPAGAGAWFGG